MFKNLRMSRHNGLALATMLVVFSIVAICILYKVEDLNEQLANFSWTPLIIAFLAGSATTMLAVRHSTRQVVSKLICSNEIEPQQNENKLAVLTLQEPEEQATELNDFIANARLRLAKSAQARESISGVQAEVKRIARIISEISSPIKGHSTTIHDE